jgi:N-acetylneuraminic acid mutarotase
MTIPGNQGNRNEGVAVVVGTKGYFGLGKSGTSPYPRLKDFWQYDFILSTWQQLPDFPGSPRMDAVAFVIGNVIYVGTG